MLLHLIVYPDHICMTNADDRADALRMLRHTVYREFIDDKAEWHSCRRAIVLSMSEAEEDVELIEEAA